jgi:hypothetical protein
MTLDEFKQKARAHNSQLTEAQLEQAYNDPATWEKPPMPNARKAPDGKWYVPDPQRPGKYQLVQG